LQPRAAAVLRAGQDGRLREIPQEPYADIVRLLLAAGAKIPERGRGERTPPRRRASLSSASSRWTLRSDLALQQALV
jgi:hypothetical protein